MISRTPGGSRTRWPFVMTMMPSRARFRACPRISHAKSILRKNAKKLIAQLQDALAEIKQLDGLMPICSYCKKIRNDDGYWQQIEQFIASKTEARFNP